MQEEALCDFITDHAAGLSVIVGSVSSPLKAAPVETSTVTCVRRAARVGRGLTAHRLTSHDLSAMSQMEQTSSARGSDLTVNGLAILAVPE